LTFQRDACNVLPMETKTAAPAATTVIADDAPNGVQLWPTLTPAGAPNFTLERVEIVRDAYRTFVRWVYESGTTRTFILGERVAVEIQRESLSDYVARKGFLGRS
jgi:hypothetical protein